MAIFTPTAFYFGQPIVSAGGGYIVRPDTYASSVTVAIPGTKFGSTFGQATYRSDISGYINGGSSFADAATTGSNASSTTVKFGSDGYSTSMQRGTTANVGCLPGAATEINFGSGAFTIECWFNSAAVGNDIWAGFKYNAGWGFFGWSSAGYFRWVAQNASFGETLVDYTSTPSGNTWYHIAFCRSGNTWYACLNGTIRGNLTLSGAIGTSTGHQMMGWAAAAMSTTVFQDYRVTKGVARYTGSVGASYTVPQSIVMNA